MLKILSDLEEICGVLSSLEECGACQMLYGSEQFIRFIAAASLAEVECVVLEQEGIVRAVLPYMKKLADNGLGWVVNSMPWYGSHGGVILSPSADESHRRTILIAYKERISDPEISFATLITTPLEEKSHADVYEKSLQADLIDERNGQITYLPSAGVNTLDSIFSHISQKTRNLARKSLKQGFVELVTDDDWAWDFLYQTHEENMFAVGGIAKPVEHFNALRKYIDVDKKRLSVAMLDGKPIAAMLLICYGDWVEYITPVIKVEYRNQQPLSFLIVSAMVSVINSGYRYWNWGGTWHSQKSLHHFKAGWGGKDHPYRYYIHAKLAGLAQVKSLGSFDSTACPFFYIYPFDRMNVEAES